MVISTSIPIIYSLKLILQTLIKTVSLKLTLKDSIPEKAITVCRLNNVFIDQNYSLNEEIEGGIKDTTGYAEYIFSG